MLKRRVSTSLIALFLMTLLLTFGVTGVASAHSSTPLGPQVSQGHVVPQASCGGAAGAAVVLNFITVQCIGTGRSVDKSGVTQICAFDNHVSFNGNSIASGSCQDFFLASGRLTT